MKQCCLPRIVLFTVIQLGNNSLNTLTCIMEGIYIDTTSPEDNVAISITHLCT